MKKALLASLALGGSTFALSQTFAYDNFEGGASGGTGFAGGSSWDGPLAYSNADPLRGMGTYVTIGEFGESFRQLSSSTVDAINARTAGGNSVWVGFLARWTGPVGPGTDAYGGVQLRTGPAGAGLKRFFMGTLYNKANWGAGTKYDTLDVESSAPVTGTAFLSYELNMSTQRASMHVNNVQVLSDLELNDGANQMTFFSWMKIEAGFYDTQHISIDELRVGATSADVQAVPEPATLAALGLGAATMLRRRRK